MKKSFATLAVVLVTLCTTSTVLADTPAPAPIPASGEIPVITIPTMPQFYYSAARSGGVQPSFTARPQNLSVREGGKVAFTMTVTGVPMPMVSIYKNGRCIAEQNGLKDSPERKRYHISTDNRGRWVFQIADITSDDAGDYMFKITNELGTAAVTVKLTVIK